MDAFHEKMADQFSELRRGQPHLSLLLYDSGIKITGPYVVYVEFNNEQFLDSFSLEIVVDKGFPETVPIVKELERRIRPVNCGAHIYPDGHLCLEVNTRIIFELNNNPNLLFFSDTFIQPYLFGFLYYQKYHRFPFGEYAHGKKGVLEYYCTVFDVCDVGIAKELLGLIFGDNLKGHRYCPCGSGKRFRDCHRNQTVTMKESEFLDHYYNDFLFVSR